MFLRVAEFHQAFGHPVGLEPAFPEANIRKLRLSLIEEELNEYCDAFDRYNRIDMADALADLLYVLAGTAVAYGFAPNFTVESPYDADKPEINKQTSEAFDTYLREDYWAICQAEQDNDIDLMASAVFHMMVEVFGVAYRSHIPINAVFSEVHRSNLSKLMPDGTVLKREDGKILKGPNYFKPNITAILGITDNE